MGPRPNEGEDIARTRLAGAGVVCPISVGKACEWETVVRAPPQSHAHVDGAMEVSKDLFESLHVCVRGGCLGGAENAQRRGEIGTRAYGRVLETAHETRVDVLGHAGEGWRRHVLESGEEAGVHREGRWLRFGHAVLGEDVA
jgi:hypothetical protein